MGVGLGAVQPGPAYLQLDKRLPLSLGSKQRNPGKSIGDRKTDGRRRMYGAQGWGRERALRGGKSFVTVASSKPDDEQDLTLTSWNLLDCFRKAGCCVVVPETYGKVLPLL